MRRSARPRTITRFLALVVFAYVLALNGLLGSLAAGAHVAEARIAAQLGVICTIHGIGNSGADGTQDQAPGKLACIEHCVLGSSGATPAVLLAAIDVIRHDPSSRETGPVALDAGHRIAPVSAPPPSRGPPALI